MRTVRTKVYKFNELSDEAKQYAIEKRRENQEYFWGGENRNTLEAFERVFPVNITDWSYGGRGEGVSFTFTESDEVEELTGHRLATYIWNNHFHDLFKRKWYSKSWDAKKRVLDPSKGKTERYSKIIFEHSCVLTGYCIDEDILKPIYDFLKKPDNNTNFRDLLESCFDAWVKACNEDIEYQNSDEYIAEELESNDFEFTKEGRIF